MWPFKKRLRFQPGDICLHVGKGDFAPNERVEIVRKGPWPAHGKRVFLQDGSEGWNKRATDYIIRSVGASVMAFCEDENLKPLPPEDLKDYIHPDTRALFSDKLKDTPKPIKA